MVPTIKETDLPDDLRKTLASRRQRLLARLTELTEESGKVLYELHWLHPADTRKAHRALGWRSWLTTIETLLFALILSAVALFVALLVGRILGI